MVQPKEEAEEHYLERVETPDPNDILCGKDKNCVHAPGSIRFRKIIESYRQRYANCLTKFDKMLITKEIYETLSATSRFLKYNSKEKIWEEISPMAARDKCGHALRFANRLKNKNSKKKAEAALGRAQSSGSTTITANSSVSSLASLSKTVSPTLGSAKAGQTNAPAATPRPATVSASVSPTAAINSYSQQTMAPPPATAQQQHLWGELVKRYNSMWNATQIPSLTGNLRAPMAAPAPGVLNGNTAAITALAAAAAVRSNPALLASLTNPLGAAPSPTSALLSAVAAVSAAPTPATVPQQRRRPTLDDLCSILNVENVAAKGK